MARSKDDVSFHDAREASKAKAVWLGHSDTQFTYTFENFFHPFVGELISKLNKDSLPGMLAGQLDPDLKRPFFKDLYNPSKDNLVQVEYFPKEIDVAEHGPYANYNWELFFHIPLTIAVHLSKTQRFAEAQRWFHYIFNPTSNEQTVDPPMRFWKFLAFRKTNGSRTIDEILRLLSTPSKDLNIVDQRLQAKVMDGYTAILNKPFQPHVVARTRHLAYQYCVVMKYLDNLIAWGDNLFQQDTVESINEATQHYVLAANLLGQRPQRIPARGTVTPENVRAAYKGRPRPDRQRDGGPGGSVSHSISPRRPPFLAMETARDRSLASDGRSTSAFRATKRCSAIGTRSQTGCSRFATA